jgi:hypothetical protein
VLGLSGAPVFNVSQRALCGMVMRGGMNENLCTIWYADMFDIGQLLAAVHEERSEHYYRKNITRIVKTAKGAGAS